jgi:hypothetical protein
MPPADEPYSGAKDSCDPAVPAEKPICNKRLFSSQETFLAGAFIEPKID